MLGGNLAGEVGNGTTDRQLTPVKVLGNIVANNTEPPINSNSPVSTTNPEDFERTVYIWQGEITGWGGPDSYPSSANHERGNGEDNFYYIDLTNIGFCYGYGCGLELMNPYSPYLYGTKDEMAQFIKEMKNPRIKVTLQNGGTASSWNWDTELSFPSGKEVAMPDGYLDTGYFALFGNDDVITKVEIYDIGQGGSHTSTTPKPVTTPSPTQTSNPSETIVSGNTGDPKLSATNTLAATQKPSITTTTDDKDVKKPGKVTGLDLSCEGKKLLVSWDWKSDASGYQIQYAQNKKFTKKKSMKNAGKYAQDKTIRGLQKGKLYYVRVRAYKKESGKKLYGKWSKVKKIRIK